MNPIALVVLSAFSDFVIAGGSVLLGGNLQGGGLMPTPGVWIAAGITGAVAFAKEVKQNIQAAKEEHASNQAAKP